MASHDSQETLAPERFSLKAERLGPLPLLNHLLGRLELDDLLERFVPTPDSRTKLRFSKCLGVLLRSILVEREPIYRQHETVAAYDPKAFGLTGREAATLNDDSLGRALDRLFSADRGSLLTASVVAAAQRFGIGGVWNPLNFR